MMPDNTLVDLVRQHAQSFPDRLLYRFLGDGDDVESEVTYAMLHTRARAVAAALAERIRPGDRVLLLYPPGADFVEGFFGTLYAGGIPVPAYPPDPARLERTLPRFTFLLGDAQCTAALTTSPILSVAEAIFELAPELKKLHWLATDTTTVLMPEEAIRSGRSDDVCFLQYTSGSTGAPKGVMLSHRSLLANEAQIASTFQNAQESVVVSWLPVYHDMGLIGCLFHPLWRGGNCTLMSPIGFLQKPIRWLRAITKYRASMTGGPNFCFDLCIRRVKDADMAELDLSSWGVAFCGAERVRPNTMERFINRFSAVGFRKDAFLPVYGLAEASLLVTGRRHTPIVVDRVDKAQLEEGRRAVSTTADGGHLDIVGCGEPAEGESVSIVDADTLVELPEGHVGEIWVQGPNVSLGYWQQPERTQRDFRATRADGAGPFLRTGDLGYLRNRELFIVGRLKDIVIIRGRNFFPDDLEMVVENAHRSIRPGCSAAFAIDHNDTEQLVIVAEIERRRLDSATTQDPRRSEFTPHVHDPGELPHDHEEIALSIQQKLSESFQLRADRILLLRAGSIPKTSSGKVQRHACKRDSSDGTMAWVYELKIGS